ncbi:MAG: thioredoxin family protein [Burkholderiales bacterium]
MTNPAPFTRPEPARADIDALRGLALLEFGTDWCGWCRAAQGPIGEALAAHPDVRHIRVEDGPGRGLGRSFGVKLWPTLVFLRDGREVERLARPAGTAVADALARTAGG